MKKLTKSLFLLLAGFTLSGANLHLQTSANKSTGNLIINLHKKQIRINLFSPEITVKSYPNGKIEHLSFNHANSHYEITFHPNNCSKSEQVSLCKEFKWFGKKLVLDGKTLKLSPEGSLLSLSNYKDGMLQGVQQIYSADQKLIDEKHFDKGLPVNTWSQYYVSGVIARTITFPASSSLWAKTGFQENYMLINEKNTLYGLSLKKEIDVLEEWFNEEGIKLKEQHYLASKEGKRIQIKNANKFKSFDQEGKVIRASHTIGKYFIDTTYNYRGKQPYKVSSYWLNGKKLREEKSANF